MTGSASTTGSASAAELLLQQQPRRERRVLLDDLLQLRRRERLLRLVLLRSQAPLPLLPRLRQQVLPRVGASSVVASASAAGAASADGLGLDSWSVFSDRLGFRSGCCLGHGLGLGSGFSGWSRLGNGLCLGSRHGVGKIAALRHHERGSAGGDRIGAGEVRRRLPEAVICSLGETRDTTSIASGRSPSRERDRPSRNRPTSGRRQ